MIKKFIVSKHRVDSLTVLAPYQLLSVANQREELAIWVADTDGGEEVTLEVEPRVTGAPQAPRPCFFLGTVLFSGGDFVVHVFVEELAVAHCAQPPENSRSAELAGEGFVSPGRSGGPASRSSEEVAS